MSSSDSSDHLDLARGLPVSAEDVAALRRLRVTSMNVEEYFEFLASLPEASYEELKARRGPSGAPFVLKP